MIPITEFAGREVAVFGLARSGLSAARALKAGGAIVHAWDDNEAARAQAIAEGVPVSDINQRDWRGFAALVLSPGVPLRLPQPHRVVELARAVGVPVLGDIELFARAINAQPAHARPRIVGVTGTNGKSTTTALIHHIVREAGRDARIGGNFGAGVLGLEQLHAGAVYVLELSSYQLDLTASLRCTVAVFLNLAPDHLDRHGDMDGYLAAKKRIFINQGSGDTAIVGVDDAYGAQICTELKGGPRTVVAISSGQALGRGVSTLGGRLYDAMSARAELVMDLASAPALPGRHNAQNIAAAYAATRALGIASREIVAAIATFPGLEHRMERAGEIAGVRFINDSKATNVDAAAQALSCYKKIYWIAGGKPKDGGLDALERFFPRIERAYLIGEAAPLFAVALNGKVSSVQCGVLDKAVTQAFKDARAAGDPDAVVLFSPACASFDQFKDFEERGSRFKTLVNALDDVVRERASL